MTLTEAIRVALDSHAAAVARADEKLGRDVRAIATRHAIDVVEAGADDRGLISAQDAAKLVEKL